jgi:hypothetical protein
MSGRAVTEMMRAGKAAPKFHKEEITVQATNSEGNYSLTLFRTISDKYQYVDHVKVVRKSAQNVGMNK